jgi:hypothetical protein
METLMKPENVEPPHTFDRWLVGMLTVVGLFAVYGFSFIH